MNPAASARPDVRFLMPYLVPFLIALLLAITAGNARAASDASTLVTRGDLGVTTALVSPDAAVHTPEGRATGAEGVTRYIASLRERFPAASFTTTGTRTVSDLLIVDWQGERDGRVVIPGRTLIRFEDGAIAEIHFLNLNDVSPSTAR